MQGGFEAEKARNLMAGPRGKGGLWRPAGKRLASLFRERM